MAKKKAPPRERLVGFAETIREKLEFRGQDALFGAAVEIGHLAAHADGEMDGGERQQIIDAIEILSKGLVVEWEVDSILEAAANTTQEEAQRAGALGARLRELGQPEAGLLVGAFVAQASSGIDKSERRVLAAVGKAAGLSDAKVRDILKAVGDS